MIKSCLLSLGLHVIKPGLHSSDLHIINLRGTPCYVHRIEQPTKLNPLHQITSDQSQRADDGDDDDGDAPSPPAPCTDCCHGNSTASTLKQ